MRKLPVTGEFFINIIQTVSAVHKLTTHKTHIKNIELIVLAKVGSLPVRELSIRNSKQPLLQEHNISNTEFAVSINISGNDCFRHIYIMLSATYPRKRTTYIIMNATYCFYVDLNRKKIV